MIWTIRLVGWFGIGINAIAICFQNLQLFLWGQLVAAISAFLWAHWLQKSLTPDLILSLALSIVAAITKNQFVLYAALVVRSISYQLLFERVLKTRVD